MSLQFLFISEDCINNEVKEMIVVVNLSLLKLRHNNYENKQIFPQPHAAPASAHPLPRHIGKWETSAP
jgi:hypothetical protein